MDGRCYKDKFQEFRDLNRRKKNPEKVMPDQYLDINRIGHGNRKVVLILPWVIGITQLSSKEGAWNVLLHSCQGRLGQITK